ncbi:MAG: hypothetical protein KatS3mg039_0717 [Candidatus Kapaibacterium sp.]|nr:MAG: hypothetical protein KatS3mg039_0717 [Candidatus Kapabacteria bacterium]
MTTQSKPEFSIERLSGVLLFVAAMSRLLPHPPNLAPITAMAVFSGWVFPSYRSAVVSVVTTMLASDLALALFHWDWGYIFHGMLPIVYGTFALIIALARVVSQRSDRWGWSLPTLLASSAIFFVITNFFVWALGSMYPKTWEGLATCYAMAVPFYHVNGLAPFELVRNALLGDVLYGGFLLGGYVIARRYFDRFATAPAR